MLLYWQCQAEPIFVSSDGKAARAAGLFFVVNGSGSMPVMRQQTGASERRQYSNRQEQVSTGNTATGRNRSAPAIQRQAGAGQHQQYNRQEQISASNTTTTRNRSAAQTAFRPAEQKNRLSLTPPIQQHTGIYQYTTPYHSAEQRRARKGGARGGKTGFVTLSAFPPRKPAHAKVSPRKGKSFTAKVSPLERNYPSEDTGSPPRSVRQTPDIVQYLVQFSH